MSCKVKYFIFKLDVNFFKINDVLVYYIKILVYFTKSDFI